MWLERDMVIFCSFNKVEQTYAVGIVERNEFYLYHIGTQLRVLGVSRKASHSRRLESHSRRLEQNRQPVLRAYKFDSLKHAFTTRYVSMISGTMHLVF